MWTVRCVRCRARAVKVFALLPVQTIAGLRALEDTSALALLRFLRDALTAPHQLLMPMPRPPLETHADLRVVVPPRPNPFRHTAAQTRDDAADRTDQARAMNPSSHSDGRHHLSRDDGSNGTSPCCSGRRPYCLGRFERYVIDQPGNGMLHARSISDARNRRPDHGGTIFRAPHTRPVGGT